MDASRDGAGAWDRRHTALALRAAAVCVTGLILTWVMAELVPATRLRDAAALHGFIDLGRPSIDAVANRLLELINPVLCTLFAGLLAVLAARRGARRLALAVPLVIGGSVGTSELLKPLLAHSHDFVVATSYVTDASWPSGHATAAMSMALCAVLVAPRRLRPLVAVVGALATVAVGFSLLTLAWHMPSDVIGGFLVAALWTALAVAAVLASRQRWPTRVGQRPIAPLRVSPAGADGAPTQLALALLVGVALMLAALVALRPTEVADFAGAHHSLMVAAAAIASLAGALVCGATVGLRR